MCSPVLSKKVKMIISCLHVISAAGLLSAGLVPQPESRVLSGRNMDIEEAPWQVSLQFRGEHYCGGSIYSKNIIITAAHCFYEIYDKEDLKYRLISEKEFLVVAGSAYKRSRKNIFGVSVYYLTTFNFENSNEKDIGILKLSKPLKYSKQIRPIPLAKVNPSPGSVALSTGWGRINKISRWPDVPELPEMLQGINISIGNFDNCKCSMPWMKNGTLCAGEPGRSGSKGDSGGPLVFKNTLVGVVSGGGQVGKTPGIYTSVADYRKWLLNAIKFILKM
ncbi:hypothetical protein KR054_009806 [Drosophila jambulina]|nr:hypothetical protein KR054_009806 [Drosophila jambulina]